MTLEANRLSDQMSSVLDLLKGKISPDLWEKLSQASTDDPSTRQATKKFEERLYQISDSSDTKLTDKTTSSASSPDMNTALSIVSGPSSTRSGALKRKRPSSEGHRRVKAMSARGYQVFQPSGPLRLRIDHPIQADRPTDIWKIILSYSHPKFLRSAWRINKETYCILKAHSSIWKQARLEHYGYDMPAIPEDMDEWTLSTLMDGKKCSSCKVRGARNVFWSLRARLCNLCFHKQAILVSTVLFAMLLKIGMGLKDFHTA
jgi:hypothetical protein